MLQIISCCFISILLSTPERNLKEKFDSNNNIPVRFRFNKKVVQVLTIKSFSKIRCSYEPIMYVKYFYEKNRKQLACQRSSWLT